MTNQKTTEGNSITVDPRFAEQVARSKAIAALEMAKRKLAERGGETVAIRSDRNTVFYTTPDRVKKLQETIKKYGKLL